MATDQFRELIRAVERMSMDELRALYPLTDLLSGAIAIHTSQVDNGTAATALALVFGSLAFDAEMQLALRGEQSVTFDDRMDLFREMARVSYNAVREFSKITNAYDDGKPIN